MFFGWGLLVAISSVWLAPHAQRWIGTARSLVVINLALTALMVVMALCIGSPGVLAACVVVSGHLLRHARTHWSTQTVMSISPVDRPIASAGYSFVRFMGGAIAPLIASQLAERIAPAAAFWFGAGGFLLAAVVCVAAVGVLRGADKPVAARQRRGRHRVRRGRGGLISGRTASRAADQVANGARAYSERAQVNGTDPVSDSRAELSPFRDDAFQESDSAFTVAVAFIANVLIAIAKSVAAAVTTSH